MSDEIKRQYVNYLFFKTDPAWRQLSREERDHGRSEFEGVVKDWKSRVLMIPFTTVGTRADTDFVLWRVSERLEDFTEMSTQLLNTSLGKWLHTPYSYLGMTKRSMYVDITNTKQRGPAWKVVARAEQVHLHLSLLENQ